MLSFLTYSYSIPYSKQKNLYEAAQDLSVKTSFCYFRLSFIYTIRQAASSMLSAASHVPLFYVILFCKYQDQKQEIKARLCMDQLNDRSVVEQRYATATNLQTRISIHDKYSTNKMGYGN